MASQIETRSNGLNSPWSTERETRLTQLYIDGASFREIANEIGISRNAVIGKAHRMKLKPRDVVIVPKPVIYPKPEPKPRYRRRRQVMYAVSVNNRAEPQHDPDIDHRCTITGLTNSTCRFPMWPFAASPDTERLYCGAPGADMTAGQPYCRKHARMCNTQRQ